MESDFALFVFGLVDLKINRTIIYLEWLFGKLKTKENDLENKNLAKTCHNVVYALMEILTWVWKTISVCKCVFRVTRIS